MTKPKNQPVMPLGQQINADIVAYVAKANSRGWSPTFSELHLSFGQSNDGSDSTNVFRTRLQHLVQKRRLQALGTGALREFSLCFKDDDALVHLCKDNNIVPPRQFDVMHGPLYTPDATPPARAHSLDFKRIPSRGHCC